MYYLIILVLLFLAELFYFHIADKYNIIDKPNKRSSHTRITLRGGGIIFYLGVDFVLNCKLKRAATMLTENPDLQIADISDRLGFGSPRYFTRCFKAQFEITPAEYRKKTVI